MPFFGEGPCDTGQAAPNCSGRFAKSAPEGTVSIVFPSLRLQGANGQRSPPRESVLSVPNRNVLLTGGRWGVGENRSSHNDPAGQRPSGGAEEGTEEFDHAAAGGCRVGHYGAPGAAYAAAAEGGGRKVRHSQAGGQPSNRKTDEK